MTFKETILFRRNYNNDVTGYIKAACRYWTERHSQPFPEDESVSNVAGDILVAAGHLSEVEDSLSYAKKMIVVLAGFLLVLGAVTTKLLYEAAKSGCLPLITRAYWSHWT